MDIFVFHEGLIQKLIHEVRLVRVCAPSSHWLETFRLQCRPVAFLDHELTGHFVPALLPIQASVEDDDDHVIHAHIAANECEPAAGHGSELILVLDEPIVVKFILVE